MKRIIVMLTLAAMLVVALTVTAAPSFADPDCAPPTKPNCKANGGKFTGNGGSGGGSKPPGQTNNPNPGK
jgi:hypothetical protein